MEHALGSAACAREVFRRGGEVRGAEDVHAEVLRGGRGEREEVGFRLAFDAREEDARGARRVGAFARDEDEAGGLGCGWGCAIGA